MGFSSIVTALILFACIGQMRAAVVFKIPGLEQTTRTSEKFKLHITERGTKFDENIEIDEENDIEYFKVPPHNELSETDNMYDFKMNITVSRVNSDRVCHITPLPSDLPRPNVLSKGLKMLANFAPSHKIENPAQDWRVGDLVDKWTLRPEVREFCGQFPVYRLEPFIPPDSVSVVAEDGDDDTRAERIRRQFKSYPLCNRRIPQCHPNYWVYSCRITSRSCVYYAKCRLDQPNAIVSCSSLVHGHSNLRCCVPSCSNSIGPWPGKTN